MRGCGDERATLISHIFHKSAPFFHNFYTHDFYNDFMFLGVIYAKNRYKIITHRGGMPCVLCRTHVRKRTCERATVLSR
ncbi:hypothetical protein [Moraxella lacunata]|uniref:hypothetical protein n=1 Tax=Moraxella lacunata TaxID=477 RepID=UPI003EDF0E6E